MESKLMNCGKSGREQMMWACSTISHVWGHLGEVRSACQKELRLLQPEFLCLDWYSGQAKKSSAKRESSPSCALWLNPLSLDHITVMLSASREWMNFWWLFMILNRRYLQTACVLWASQPVCSRQPTCLWPWCSYWGTGADGGNNTT